MTKKAGKKVDGYVDKWSEAFIGRHFEHVPKRYIKLLSRIKRIELELNRYAFLELSQKAYELLLQFAIELRRTPSRKGE